MGRFLKNKRGQAVVGWLMVLAAASLVAFVVLTGPIASFTTDLLAKVQLYTKNIVLRGEADVRAPSPTAAKRFKPVHL